MDEEKPRLTSKRISILAAQIAERLNKQTDGKEEAIKVLEIVQTLLSKSEADEHTK